MLRLLASFNNNLLSCYHVPGHVLGARDIQVNQTDKEAYILAKDIDSE